MTSFDKELVRYLDNLSEDGKDRVIMHLLLQKDQVDATTARADIMQQVREFSKMYPAEYV